MSSIITAVKIYLAKGLTLVYDVDMSESEKNVEKDKEASEKKGPSTFAKLRGNHKFRIGFIVVLLVIVGVMFFFWEKMRIVLAIAFIALLAALGLEASQNDFDLGKLMQTKSLEQSKVSRDTAGNILFDKLGNITTDKTAGKKADDYNCSDFTTQPDAQSFFLKVGGKGNDLNRLDGDKDGDACESLPKNGK